MVGMGVLLECLDSDRIESVLVVGRTSCNVIHDKLTEVLIPSLDQLSESGQDLSIYDACYFCAGISVIGLSEEKYTAITYGLTINFAKEYFRQRQGGIFCYVSGTGTDSSEKGRSMWARVKGKTENDLKKIGFDSAYMFRPGFIYPMKGIKTKTKWYGIIYALFKPIYHLIKYIPNAATNTTNVGLAMIAILDHSSDPGPFENREINELARLIS